MARRKSARCTVMSGPAEYRFEVHMYPDIISDTQSPIVHNVTACEAQVDEVSLNFYDGDSRLIAAFDNWRFFIRKEKVLAVSVEHTD